MLTAVLVGLALVAAVFGLRSARRTAVLERRLAKSSAELEHLQSMFGRFAPAEVVERLAADGLSIEPDTKDVTILFADLKGFTALAERLEPAQLVALLNGYFDAMGRTIVAHRGHLAKFIGDGLLAFFGGLEPNPWQTNDAMHAALAMREALRLYNERSSAEGRPTLQFGIGIHRGPVVAGVLGTSSLLEYGVIGRTVNLTARIEELTRVHGVDILVSTAVAAACDPRFVLRPMAATPVKGIAEPLATLALEGLDAEASSARAV